VCFFFPTCRRSDTCERKLLDQRAKTLLGTSRSPGGWAVPVFNPELSPLGPAAGTSGYSHVSRWFRPGRGVISWPGRLRLDCYLETVHGPLHPGTPQHAAATQSPSRVTPATDTAPVLYSGGLFSEAGESPHGVYRFHIYLAKAAMSLDILVVRLMHI
jgi:hypothetical protein